MYVSRGGGSEWFRGVVGIPTLAAAVHPRIFLVKGLEWLRVHWVLKYVPPTPFRFGSGSETANASTICRNL